MVALMAGYAYGQSAGGTIPFVSDLNLTSAATGALASITEADYDAGKFTISNFISAADFAANDSCKIDVKVGSWTLPAGYLAGGNKNSVTANSDFHLLINGIIAAEEMTVQGGFATSPGVELTSTDQVVLKADNTDGVDLLNFTADAQVDLDWASDPVGAYSIAVTFTIAQQ